MRVVVVLAALLVAPGVVGCTTPRLIVDAAHGMDAGSASDAEPDLGPPDEGPPDEGPPDLGPPDEGAPDLFVCLGLGAGCGPGQCCSPLECGSTSAGVICCHNNLGDSCGAGTECCGALDCQTHNGTGALHCCHWWNDPSGNNSCGSDYDCCGGHPCSGGHCS